jgi:hypothetical protein
LNETLGLGSYAKTSLAFCLPAMTTAPEREFVAKLTKRVGKSLRQTGAANKGMDERGNVVWARRHELCAYDDILGD